MKRQIFPILGYQALTFVFGTDQPPKTNEPLKQEVYCSSFPVIAARWENRCGRRSSTNS